MVIPSIDLMNGKAVQLKQGREKVLERDNPIELAKYFNKFNDIAVIDLDAALGSGDNENIIREICNIAECRVGGGIRDLEKAQKIASWGASKVIIGTKAFEEDQINHLFLQELEDAIGRNRIMIAIDAIEKEIVTKGWKHKTGLNLFDVVPVLEKYASDFLFTCVEKEGMMQGTDLGAIKSLHQKTQNRLTIAGGVNSIEQIKILAEIGVDTQLGMALYTDQIKLEDAYIESINWKNGLVPTITCDTAGQVLMLAYSNKESLAKTFETEKMWYFSRSRNKLWMKGETSNHIQVFKKIRTDCDKDTLLATVDQKGVACHFENYSCFGDKKFSNYELYDVINERLKNPVPGSYTAKLTDELVREKILEEAREVVEAQTREEKIWEAADLLYFWSVLLAKEGIEIDDVLNELRRRRRK